LSPALNSVRAAFVYEGVPRRAVHTFKFRSGRYLAPVLGELLRASLEQRPLHADLVTPVPLAPRRLRERGYNQAALLAEYVTDAAGASLATGLLAREDRPPQQRLSAAERMDNLLGAIRCTDPSAASHRRILLVDDVMTTGATLSACAEALADAGASHVSALVFARDV
jgi:ComF family protein